MSAQVAVADDLAERVREARKSSGFSAQQLADLLHVSKTHVLNLERGSSKGSPRFRATVEAWLEDPAGFVHLGRGVPGEVRDLGNALLEVLRVDKEQKPTVAESETGRCRARLEEFIADAPKRTSVRSDGGVRTIYLATSKALWNEDSHLPGWLASIVYSLLLDGWNVKHAMRGFDLRDGDADAEHLAHRLVCLLTAEHGSYDAVWTEASPDAFGEFITIPEAGTLILSGQAKATLPDPMQFVVHEEKTHSDEVEQMARMHLEHLAEMFAAATPIASRFDHRDAVDEVRRDASVTAIECTPGPALTVADRLTVACRPIGVHQREGWYKQRPDTWFQNRVRRLNAFAENLKTHPHREILRKEALDLYATKGKYTATERYTAPVPDRILVLRHMVSLLEHEPRYDVRIEDKPHLTKNSWELRVAGDVLLVYAKCGPDRDYSLEFHGSALSLYFREVFNRGWKDATNSFGGRDKVIAYLEGLVVGLQPNE